MDIAEIRKLAWRCIHQVKGSILEQITSTTNQEEVTKVLKRITSTEPKVIMCLCPKLNNGEIYFAIPKNIKDSTYERVFRERWELFYENLTTCLKVMSLTLMQTSEENNLTIYKVKEAKQ